MNVPLKIILFYKPEKWGEEERIHCIRPLVSQDITLQTYLHSKLKSWYQKIPF
jgi:hypothetical protein